MDRTEQRLAAVWTVMVAMTLLSYTASESWFGHAKLGIASVIVLAMIKVRFVVLDFMDVRHAPLALRLILEFWIVCLATVLIVLLY